MDHFRQYLLEKAHVNPGDIEQLLSWCKLKHYAKGDLLLAKGQINKHIFFVEEGLLRFYSIDDKGKEHILQFVPENGWTSDRNNLCSDEPSEYFIDAYENSNVVVLNYDFLQKASDISEAFREFHGQILHRHIKQLYHRIDLLISRSAKERYLEFVSMYPQILQRVPQWMIASYLGLTPEGLSRVRKELASEQ